MVFTRYSGVMLTYKDLQEITKLLNEKFKESFKYLPSTELFLSRMDGLSKEIKDAREELAAHTMSHDRLTEKDEELEERVAVVEKKVGIHTLNN